MTRGAVSRLSRAIDIASILFVAGGALLYIRAYLGMDAVRNLKDVQFVPGVTEFYGVTNQFYRLQRLSHVALGMVGIGVVVGLSAAVHHHKIRKQQPPTQNAE